MRGRGWRGGGWEGDEIARGGERGVKRLLGCVCVKG